MPFLANFCHPTPPMWLFKDMHWHFKTSPKYFNEFHTTNTIWCKSKSLIKCYFSKRFFKTTSWQGLIQDLDRWSNTNAKKYCRQIGLLCSVLCLIWANMLFFKRWALFLGTTFFEYGLKNKNCAICN